MKKQDSLISHLHLGVFVLSIILAILIVKTGAVDLLLGWSANIGILGSFITGLFFTSVLTLTPATVLFFKLAQEGVPLWELALIGGLGAMIGDLLLFSFLKHNVTDDVNMFMTRNRRGTVRRLWRMKWFSWAMMVVGGLIIASPLPDELGLALMGVGKIRRSKLMIISFVFNAIGITLIALVAGSQ